MNQKRAADRKYSNIQTGSTAACVHLWINEVIRDWPRRVPLHLSVPVAPAESSASAARSQLHGRLLWEKMPNGDQQIGRGWKCFCGCKHQQTLWGRLYLITSNCKPQQWKPDTHHSSTTVCSIPAPRSCWFLWDLWSFRGEIKSQWRVTLKYFITYCSERSLWSSLKL